MYKAAIRKFPYITHMWGEMSGVNMDALTWMAVKLLCGVEPGVTGSEISDAYKQCGVQQKLKALPVDQQAQFVARALKNTPSYKSRARLGYGNIEANTFKFMINSLRIKAFYYSSK